jgi:hypothetical protein
MIPIHTRSRKAVLTSIFPDDLRSSSHYTVATALSNALVDEVAAQPRLGGTRVAEALRTIRDAIWSPLQKGAVAFAEADEKRHKLIFDAVLALLGSEKLRRQFLESYARLGHLYEIASLVARENTINRELDGFAPGGVREFVISCDSAQQAAEALSKPVFEMVMTAHPTNVNALDSIKAQRALGQAIDAVRMGEEGAEHVRQALLHFIETPLLPGDAHETENLTVQDETEFTLYYLCNLYDDLPSVYAGMDDALLRSGEYEPLTLDLKLRFGSWGSSGDKDGNAQVTADTTLDAIARHICAILDRYTASLRRLNIPILRPWYDRIDVLRQKTADLQQQIIDAGKKKGGIAPATFDKLAKNLTECRLDVQAFERAVTNVYHDTQRQDVLDLVRRIRIFGACFAKIEYRENAGEYTRVVGELVENYASQSPDERARTLTALLQHPKKVAALYSTAKSRLKKEGAGKPYSEKHAAPIAYQTLKRMELARDFPTLIHDNVLAEFTHISQLLEAVFLQVAVLKGHARATLGIVPLFESPESMKQAPAIMAEAYENPAYRAHVECIAKRENAMHPVQQIQIAHSDNARRSGLPAARAFIHTAHRELRRTGDEHDVITQFFEGGSSSDIYRGGTRATSAAVRAYGLHDFAKFTFQGGDMLNYLNYAPSSKRLFVRNFAHSAAFHVHGVELASTVSWSEKNSAPRLALHDPQMTVMADRIVGTALMGTLDDYRDHAFTGAGLGHLLRELEYDEEKLAGTAGSRAPSRGAKKSAKAKEKPKFCPIYVGERVAFARVEGVFVQPAKTVDIHKTRTITFSEALQHGGLVPTIVGSRTIYRNLRSGVNALRAAIAEKQLAGQFVTRGEMALLEYYPPNTANDAQLPAAVIRFLFKQSRLLRDVVIRLAIGVALTNFEGMRAYHPRLQQDPFLEQLESECREAANIVCAAFTGQFPETLIGKLGRKGFDAISTNQLRHLMVVRFPEMQQVLEDKSRYLSFLQALKADAREHGGMDAYSRRLTHAAGDTVTHGRMVPTDDPAYGRYLRHKLRRVLQHAAIPAMQTA